VACQPGLGRPARVLTAAARRSHRAAVEFAQEVRATAAADGVTAVVSGCIGPRGDGYAPGEAVTAEEAERYHGVQVRSFAATTADQVTALTMTNIEEATGIVRVAAARSVTCGHRVGWLLRYGRAPCRGDLRRLDGRPLGLPENSDWPDAQQFSELVVMRSGAARTPSDVVVPAGIELARIQGASDPPTSGMCL